jgi:hypothetical protein
MAPAGTVTSPRFNNKPRVTAFTDLLPKVDRGSVMKFGLKWILALMLCPTLVASGLLYLLLSLATLRTRGWNLSGRHWMLPIKLHERALGQILQPLYLRIGWELLS